MKKYFCILFTVSAVFLSACNSITDKDQAAPCEAELFAMDTYMKLTAYGENAETAVKQSQKKIEELDRLLSAEQSDSEIYKLNKNRSISPSADTLSLLKKAIEYSEMTGGSFNPTLHPITELWGFTTKKYRVPEKSEIDKLLPYAVTDNVIIYDNSIELKNSETEVDLGGIAKGYTSSKIAEIFIENGVKSGIINLGGNVRTIGTKPDGSEWNVAIENPDPDSSYLGILKTHGKAVITSGGYERNFEQNGKIYHHIIDPSTGYPADNGLVSVTVVTENDTLADALSTALFVMGEEKAVDFWKNSSEAFDIILYTDKDKLIVSEGIRNSFSSDYEIGYVSR